jgi:hypothetical protein
MPFSTGGFNFRSKVPLGGKSFDDFDEKKRFEKIVDLESNPFKFTPTDSSLKSRIRYYDSDSLWARWRRGYELYTITQSVLGSTAQERKSRGDYRLFCSFQQFPGTFIPARVFTFPSGSQEIGEQMVCMRDANSFNFYNFGLPILAVRYLGPSSAATYSQSGTTITVTKQGHNFQVGENIYLDFTSGSAIDATLPVVSRTDSTFTVTALAPASTSGNVTYYLSTVFGDSRWTTTRVRLRSIPLPVRFFTGERLADRVIEKDPGITATYSRVGSIVTVSCTQQHGLSSGNKVFVAVTSGLVTSGQYEITVLNSTDFTINTIDSGVTSGNLIVNRLIKGYRYDDYVGYTVIGTNVTTNEVIFQREDSYGTRTVSGVTETVVPAHRGFEVGRFLTTELRWQCGCQDFIRRSGYNLYEEIQRRKFPVTAITSTKPGQTLNKDNSKDDLRDSPGSFSDLGYISINNFYQLPNYKDKKATSYTNLMYYQIRWCKHIYAAMFSLVHDEGNQPMTMLAKYTQSGASININAVNHNLSANTKIQLDFTSGSAASGQYTITSIVDANNFTVVYPFSEVTAGYCTISNLREHEFVADWILEPSDKPAGNDLDVFYRNFEKENDRLKQAAERYLMMQKGMKWSGGKSITGSYNQPQQVADFDPQLVTMLMTDSIKRDSSGEVSRSGMTMNTTNRMISMMSKLLNLTPTQIQDAKFGMLDQPLISYTPSFEFGFVDGGGYVNGEPVNPVNQTSTIDCETYNPITAQDTLVDAGLYINS